MTLGPFYVGDKPASPVAVTPTVNGSSVVLSSFTAVEVVALHPDGSNVSPAISGAIQDSHVNLTFPTTAIFDVPGLFTVILTLTSAAARITADPIPVIVNEQPFPANDWILTPQVLQITGQSVPQTTLDQAVFVIQTITGRDMSDPTIYSTADRRNITMAIAWQAAWMKANPSVMTDLLATSKAVGDVSVSYDTVASGGSPFLAPLARIALKKASWRTMKTVLPNRLRDRVPVDLLNGDDEEDYGFDWVPTGGH